MNAFLASSGAVLSVMLFVAILAGVIVFLLMRRKSAREEEELNRLQNIRSLILTKVQHVKHLSTIRMDFISKFPFKDARKVFGREIPGTSINFNLRYSGTLVCGCDLDKVQIACGFHNGNHLRITFPNSQILDIYPHTDSFEFVDKDGGIFAKGIEVEKLNREVALDVERVKQDYIAKGILLQSNANIQQLFRSYIEPLGVVPEISFEELGNTNRPRLTGG
ncbi:MAG: DUF4230 domain-containing protein [Selenomonadaceae bacterium]|nr:DUF4230 domain-containing protein [Selenomonadaceae bacterium]